MAWEHLQAKLDHDYLKELTGRAAAAMEISDLDFEAIESFYEEPDEAETA